jgi:hypothetical protein
MEKSAKSACPRTYGIVSQWLSLSNGYLHNVASKLKTPVVGCRRDQIWELYLPVNGREVRWQV